MDLLEEYLRTFRTLRHCENVISTTHEYGRLDPAIWYVYWADLKTELAIISDMLQDVSV